MSNENQPELPGKEESPGSKSGQAVVQCEGFRCIGFQLADGTWVDSHGKPLKVVEVLTWIGK